MAIGGRRRGGPGHDAQGTRMLVADGRTCRRGSGEAPSVPRARGAGEVLLVVVATPVDDVNVAARHSGEGIADRVSTEGRCGSTEQPSRLSG